MTDAVKALIELIRQDKRTTWIAALCVALYGAGETLRAYAFEPWGSIVIGLGGCVAGGALLFAKFVKRDEVAQPAPPPDTTSATEPPK